MLLTLSFPSARTFRGLFADETTSCPGHLAASEDSDEERPDQENHRAKPSVVVFDQPAVEAGIQPRRAPRTAGCPFRAGVPSRGLEVALPAGWSKPWRSPFTPVAALLRPFPGSG